MLPPMIFGYTATLVWNVLLLSKVFPLLRSSLVHTYPNLHSQITLVLGILTAFRSILYSCTCVHAAMVTWNPFHNCSELYCFFFFRQLRIGHLSYGCKNYLKTHFLVYEDMDYMFCGFCFGISIMLAILFSHVKCVSSGTLEFSSCHCYFILLQT